MTINILCDLDAQGGFTAVDRVTGISAYAYPTSTYATKARTRPSYVAKEMIARELKVAHLHETVPGCKERDRERLVRICRARGPAPADQAGGRHHLTLGGVRLDHGDSG